MNKNNNVCVVAKYFLLCLLFMKFYLSECNENEILIERNEEMVCVCKRGYEYAGKCLTKTNDENFINVTVCSIDGDCKNDKQRCIDGKCHCKNGYMVNSEKTQCEDIDECMSFKNKCGHNYKCKNTPGSYKCDCRDGHYLSESKCVKQQECRAQVKCLGENYECVYTNKKQKVGVCKCKTGYTMSEDGKCNDIDECKEGTKCTKENEMCKNIPGSYICKCNKGFIKNSDGVCIESDICRDDNDCDENEYCKQSKYSIFKCNPGATVDEEETKDRCVCKKGFELKTASYQSVILKSKVQPVCADVNECAKNGTCGRHEECVNLNGSHECRCKNGLSRNKMGLCALDLEHCVDKKIECTIPKSFCSKKVNKCVCITGYILNEEKKVCEDIDECKHLNVCDTTKNLACKNTEGSYECICKNGYKSVNGECVQDKNGCTTDEECGANSKCASDTAMTCMCDDGFHDDDISNKNCLDINECLADNECPEDSLCVNTAGSYECRCANGVTITKSELLLLNNPASSKKTTCENVFHHCNTRKRCGANSNCISEYCICNKGYSRIDIKDSRGKCSDINECNTPGLCPESSTCVNTPGSYYCDCTAGFMNPGYVANSQEKDELYCIDASDYVCAATALCDKETQYCIKIQTHIPVCECKPGYYHLQDLYWYDNDEVKDNYDYTESVYYMVCEDVDECETDPTICGSLTCVNIVGGYECRNNGAAISTFSYTNYQIRTSYECKEDSYWYMNRCRHQSHCIHYRNFCQIAVNIHTSCVKDTKAFDDDYGCRCNNENLQLVNSLCVEKEEP